MEIVCAECGLKNCECIKISFPSELVKIYGLEKNEYSLGELLSLVRHGEYCRYDTKRI